MMLPIVKINKKSSKQEKNINMRPDEYQRGTKNGRRRRKNVNLQERFDCGSYLLSTFQIDCET